MITKKQHAELCKNLYILRLNGVEVNALGRRIISVDVESNEIRIQGNEKLTWRSYVPTTTLDEAYKKFQIPSFTLFDYRKMKRKAQTKKVGKWDNT